MPEPGAWQVLASETLLDYAPWLRVERQRVRLPNGLVLDDYLLTPARDYSLVVAVTDARQVVVVRQYKHGLGRCLTEFPAGYLDDGEDPLACARRELREETGFEAGRWQPLGAFCPDPNRSANLCHLFLARELRPAAAPHPDAAEILQAHLVAPEQVAGLLASGEMPTLACAAAWGLAAPCLAAAT
jgi:8-oxo-dGTP pyrophosphatase MutT (NUDIX family)